MSGGNTNTNTETHYIANHSDLLAVANAIRSKGGTTEPLAFPTEMVTAIYNIPGTLPMLEKTATPSTSDVETTPDEGYALSKVTTKAVALNASANCILHGASASITSNGATIATVNGTIPQALAATYNTSTSDQTIPAGQYLNGVQTIKAVKTANISAANIKDGVTVKVGDANDDDRIVNVTGTFTDSSTITGSGKSAASASNILVNKSAFLDGAQIDGTMPNNGATGTTITAQGGTYTIPAGYTSGGTVKAQIAASSLDNSIISGEAIEEATGDYAWKSTVAVPAGYHNAQTLTKTFSEVFPAPETPATATQMLSGYQAYNKSGVLMTGTMPNNGLTGTTISTQGGTYTIPQGYTSGGTVTASINNGVITSGAGSATISDPSYNSTAGNFTLTASGTVAAPTVGTAGYVSSTAGTKNTNTVSGSKTLAKIVGSTAFSGTTVKTPLIERKTLSITGVTDAASGAATVQAPTSGVYVAVQSPTNTGTITATPSVTTAGYGTQPYNGIAGNSTTVGASQSLMTYVPIKTGSATTPATTKAQSTPDISVSTTGLITSSVAGTYVDVTPTVTAGYITTGTSGRVTMSGISNTKQLPLYSGSASVTPAATDTTLTTNQKFCISDITVKGISLGGTIGSTEVSSLVALKPKILSDTVIYTKTTDGTVVSSVPGTMANNGAVAPAELACSASYTIPAGYHNGSGVVRAASLASQTAPTQAGLEPITASKVLTGYSGWVNGEEVIGSMPTTSRTASAGAVKKVEESAAVTASGTNIDVTEVSSPASSDYYVTVSGGGYIKAQGKGTVSTGTGYITSGSTDSNWSATATYTLSALKKYKIATETGSATIGGNITRTVTPTEGKLLSSVIVPANYSPTEYANYGTAQYNTGYDAGVIEGASSGYAQGKAEYEVTTATLSDAGVFVGKNAGNEEAYQQTFTNSYNKGKTDARVGNAVVANVLSGKTFTNSTSSNLTGTMPNNGATGYDGLTCGSTYTIPSGYTSGGEVVAASLASLTTPATGKTAISAAYVLNDYSGWVNGTQVNGTMTNRGKVTPSALNPGGTYTILEGYHNGLGVVSAKANTGTYTYPTNYSTLTPDLGAANLYRYVDATNVYNKGHSTGYSAGETAGYASALTEFEPKGVTVTRAGNVSVTNAAGTSKLTTTTTNSYDNGYTAGVNATKIGDATDEYVLAGKTYTSASAGVGSEGTMVDRGAVSPTLKCGQTYTVLVGYHNGNGVVTAASLSSQTPPSADTSAVTADKMVSGYSGWVNGALIEGTMSTVTTTVSGGTLTQSGNSGGGLSGGGLTAGNGSVSASSTVVTLTETSSPSGYYIQAQGSGSVSRAAVTRAAFSNTVTRAAVTESNSAGYIAYLSGVTKISKDTSTVSLAADSTTIPATSKSSNTATKYYTISTQSKPATIGGGTARTVTPDSGYLLSSVTVPANYSPTEYVNYGSTRYNAGKSDAMKGNASTAEVLYGYTFTNSSSIGVTGTMPNNSTYLASIGASRSTGASLPIPKGYHNGSGAITAGLNNSYDYDGYSLSYSGQTALKTAWNGSGHVTSAAYWTVPSGIRVRLIYFVQTYSGRSHGILNAVDNYAHHNVDDVHINLGDLVSAGWASARNSSGWLDPGTTVRLPCSNSSGTLSILVGYFRY